MATLQQIEAGIRAAEAKGDKEAAVALAKEYQRLRAAGPAPASPTPPPAATGGPGSPPAGGVATPIAAPDWRGAAAREARLQELIPGVSTNPTEGMSGLRRFGAGAGKSVDSSIRGVRQVFNYLTGDEEDSAMLEAQENEARSRDKPLMNTGTGFLGNVAGHIAQAAIPGTAAARGVKAAGGGIRSLVAAEAALGGVTGAIQPVLGDESRQTNMLVGAGLGAAIPAAGGLVNKARQLPGEMLAGVIRAATPRGGGFAADLISRGVKSGSAATRKKAGVEIAKLTDDVLVPVDNQLIRKLIDARSQYKNSLPPDTLNQIETLAKQYAKTPGFKLKGPAINEARTAMNREAAASRGYTKTGLQKVQRILDEALMANLPKAKAAALKRARNQYKTGLVPPTISAPGIKGSALRGAIQGLRTGAQGPNDNRKE